MLMEKGRGGTRQSKISRFDISFNLLQLAIHMWQNRSGPYFMQPHICIAVLSWKHSQIACPHHCHLAGTISFPVTQ